LTFRLYDAEAGGNQIGSAVALPGVPVVDGTLIVQLNGGGEFGANAFNGAARWLEIDVDGTTLSPRQALTATPYALYAAGPWAAATSGIAYTAGKVGIGRADPQFALDLRAATGFGARLGLEGNGGGALVFANNAGDNRIYLEGYNSTSNGSAAELLLTGYQGAAIPQLTLRATTTLLDGGQVGIGASPVGYAAQLFVVQPSNNWGYSAVWGSAGTDGRGVQGSASGVQGAGLFGYNVDGYGLDAQGHWGAFGWSWDSDGYGVYGYVINGLLNAAVVGETVANDGNGIIAKALSGSGAYAVWAQAPQGTGVYCQGALTVTGTKSFRIDHPAGVNAIRS
jgi:hypothetical protein